MTQTNHLVEMDTLGKRNLYEYNRLGISNEYLLIGDESGERGPGPLEIFESYTFFGDR